MIMLMTVAVTTGVPTVRCYWKTVTDGSAGVAGRHVRGSRLARARSRIGHDPRPLRTGHSPQRTDRLRRRGGRLL